MHALIKCSHAKQFWIAAKDILLLKLHRLHPETWTRDIICDPVFSPKERARITTVMYALWTSRNKITHGESGYNPTKTMEFIRETLQTLELLKEHVKGNIQRPACKWRKPPENVIKLNTDGAVLVDDGRATAGVVVRNNGGFLMATAKVYEGICGSLDC
jgi:hypothetical protein